MGNECRNRVSNYLNQSRYIRLSRALTKNLGTDAAVMISEMIDWETYLIENNQIEIGDQFYMTQELIESRTGMSVYIQRLARGILEKESLIQWDRRGIPSKHYYTINYDKLDLLITSFSNDCTGHMVPPQSFKTPTTSSPKCGLLKSIEPNSIEPNKKVEVTKELRSFEPSTYAEPQTGSVVSDGGLQITPPLIKRRVNTPIEFEKNPRQRYNSVALDIVNYWNSSPGLSHHRAPSSINGQLSAPTKTFELVISTIEKVLKGNFFNSVGLSKYAKVYTKDDLITSIDRFKLMASHLSYLPVDKSNLRKIGLNVFFFNPYSNGVPSYFIKCLENEPKHITAMVKAEEEKNPQLTAWLKESYIEKVLLGGDHKFNRIDENNFIRGANSLHHTMRHLQRRLNMTTRPNEWCNIVVDCLVDKWGRDKVYPGHVSSDFTYSDTLVRYLKGRGRLD